MVCQSCTFLICSSLKKGFYFIGLLMRSCSSDSNQVTVNEERAAACTVSWSAETTYICSRESSAVIARKLHADICNFKILPRDNKILLHKAKSSEFFAVYKLLHSNILYSKNDFTQILGKYDFFPPTLCPWVLKTATVQCKNQSSIGLSGELCRYFVRVILYIDCKLELASSSKLPLFRAEANFLLSRPTHFRGGMKELLQIYTSS